jgi:SAM-dependent methyltransferase
MENYLVNLNKDHVLTVLDVGSQCIPGQPDTYKNIFNEYNFKYVGLDMVAGYNVDIVAKNAYQWNEVPDDFCDVLISGQVLEHVEFPWFTISEMARVLKPDGMMCIIVPSMERFHRYPVNCQNYFSDGLIALAKYARLNTVHASTNRAPSGVTSLKWYNIFVQDTILIAKKPVGWRPNSFDKTNYKCEPADLEKMATGLIPIKKQKWYIKFNILFVNYAKVVLRTMIPFVYKIYIKRKRLTGS